MIQPVAVQLTVQRNKGKCLFCKQEREYLFIADIGGEILMFDPNCFRQFGEMVNEFEDSNPSVTEEKLN